MGDLVAISSHKSGLAPLCKQAVAAANQALEATTDGPVMVPFAYFRIQPASDHDKSETYVQLVFSEPGAYSGTTRSRTTRELRTDPLYRKVWAAAREIVEGKTAEPSAYNEEGLTVIHGVAIAAPQLSLVVAETDIPLGQLVKQLRIYPERIARSLVRGAPVIRWSQLRSLVSGGRSEPSNPIDPLADLDVDPALRDELAQILSELAATLRADDALLSGLQIQLDRVGPVAPLPRPVGAFSLLDSLDQEAREHLVEDDIDTFDDLDRALDGFVASLLRYLPQRETWHKAESEGTLAQLHELEASFPQAQAAVQTYAEAQGWESGVLSDAKEWAALRGALQAEAGEIDDTWLLAEDQSDPQGRQGAVSRANSLCSRLQSLSEALEHWRQRLEAFEPLLTVALLSRWQKEPAELGLQRDVAKELSAFLASVEAARRNGGLLSESAERTIEVVQRLTADLPLIWEPVRGACGRLVAALAEVSSTGTLAPAQVEAYGQLIQVLDGALERFDSGAVDHLASQMVVEVSQARLYAGSPLEKVLAGLRRFRAEVSGRFEASLEERA